MKATASLAAAALLAAVGAAAGESSSTASPTLRLLDRAPLTVRGQSFRARERVRITATGDATATRIVRASVAGAFTVVFTGATVDRCSAVRVAALGAGGSHAALKLMPSPACLPE